MSATALTHHPEIDGLLAAIDAALHAKDLHALAACYDPNVVVFDIGSQVVGYEAFAALWEQCFPYFPEPIGVERKDMHATIGADVACLSFLCRVSGMPESDGPETKSWFRTTTALRKTDDGWKVTHDHSSMPYNCMDNKITLILDD